MGKPTSERVPPPSGWKNGKTRVSGGLAIAIPLFCLLV